MSEQRSDDRFDAGLEVVVDWTDDDGTQHTAVGETRNLSDGGALLVVALDPAPPEGKEVSVRVVSPNQQAPALRAQITRYTEEGLALMFVMGGALPNRTAG